MCGVLAALVLAGPRLPRTCARKGKEQRKNISDQGKERNGRNILIVVLHILVLVYCMGAIHTGAIHMHDAIHAGAIHVHVVSHL